MSSVQLTHEIKDRIPDVGELLDGVTTIELFCSRIESTASHHFPIEDDRNEYKGLLLELFVEYLLNSGHADAHIGITDYQPLDTFIRLNTDPTINIPRDYGIDGVGRSTITGRRAVVQVKYRQDHHELKYSGDHLANPAFQAMTTGVFSDFVFANKFEFKQRVCYITTAGSISPSLMAAGLNNVHTLTRGDLARLCDNHLLFWERFRDSILASQVAPNPDQPKEPRDHQKVAQAAMIASVRDGTTKGKIILPTGTGKTLVVSRFLQEHRPQIAVVLSPRILLNIQLLCELAKDHAANGLSPRFVNFNSGEISQSDFDLIMRQYGLQPEKVPNTTKLDVVENELKLAISQNVPLIISSTYHSAPKLLKLSQEPDVVIFDEAHFLVGERFDDCFKLGKRQFSFTATQKSTDSDEGRGMNNPELFGEVLCEYKPLPLIHAGELVPPAIHIVDIDDTDPTGTTNDDDYYSIARCVTSAFDKHCQMIQNHSADPTRIAGKMLVTCDGRESLRQIMESEPLVDWCTANPDVRIYALMSPPEKQEGVSEWCIMINGVPSNSADNRAKARLLKYLQALKPTDRAIIFHVDMIAEGLDVPGITGVMPMRNLGKIKFLQTLGRAARLHTEDRAALYSGALKPMGSYIKPYAWVIIPRIMANGLDACYRYYKYINSIREEYEIDEPTIVDDRNGIEDTKETGPEFIGQSANVEQAQQVVFSASSVREFIHHTEDPEMIALASGGFWHDKMWSCVLASTAGIGDEYGTVARRLNPYFTDFDDERLQQVHKAYDTQLARHDNDPDKLEKAQLMRSGAGAFSPEIKNRFGTVWTDQRVVELTIDEAFKYYQGNLNTVEFCDPACGDGNFLITLYNRLVKLSQITDPLERSLDVLLRIYGVDIIDRMTGAARLRLVLEHVKFLQSLCVPIGADQINQAVSIVEQNVIHGNTLRSERDNWTLAEFEGGLCPQWFRDKKFGVIVGNPPYNSYGMGSAAKGKSIIKPAAYTDTKTMVESFVQWSYRHLNAAGTCGLNTTDVFLNAQSKIRKVVAQHIVSVLYTDLTKTYSRYTGGDLPTVVFVLTAAKATQALLNGTLVSQKSLVAGRFLKSAEYTKPAYQSILVVQYSALGETLDKGENGIRDDRSGLPPWDSFIAATGGTKLYIGFAYHIYAKVGRNEHFKFCMIDSPVATAASYHIGTAGHGYTKFFKIDNREYAKVLWCFLNSTAHMQTELPKYGKKKQASSTGNMAYEMNAADFFLLRVPDLEHYKTTKPEKYQAVLDFADAHIASGDVQSYCAGVDRVINDLLFDDPAYAVQPVSVTEVNQQPKRAKPTQSGILRAPKKPRPEQPTYIVEDPAETARKLRLNEVAREVDQAMDEQVLLRGVGLQTQ